MIQYEGDLSELAKWIDKDYPPLTQAAYQRRDAPPADFLKFASALLDATDLRFWATKLKPGAHRDKTGKWIRGFPHVHAWPITVKTMICYVTVAEEGGRLGIGGYSEDDPYDFVRPSPGLCLILDGNTWHGVEPVTEGERTAVIVTGFPDCDAVAKYGCA